MSSLTEKSRPGMTVSVIWAGAQGETLAQGEVFGRHYENERTAVD